MMRFRLLLLILITLKSFGQKPPKKEVNVEEMLRMLTTTRYGSQEEMTEMYEVLYQTYQNPIDLNRTTKEELENLYLLSDRQIMSLLKYLNENGKLLTVYELQVVPGFDKGSIDRILPFVEVSGTQSSQSLLKRIIKEKNHYFLFRADRILQKKRGYEHVNGYKGSETGFYARYRISHTNDFSLGITIDQDNGEAISWNPERKTYGFDFISAHAYFQNKGRFKQIALGDFSCGFGQGLVFSSGFYLGKGLESVTTARRTFQGLRPYTSAMESGYFRGAATMLAVNKLNVTLLFSRSYLDAKASSDTPNSFETLYYSGYHRTESEIASKQCLGKYDIGANISSEFLKKRLKIGLTGLVTYFDQPIVKVYRPYNKYEFRGDRNFLSSIDFSYQLHNANIFGEAALSESGGKAILTGLIASLAPQVDVAVLYRKYDRNFHSLYGNAFGEATRNSNEEGLYFGVKFYPHKKVVLSAWFDHYIFPWSTYTADGPSKGHQYQGALIYKPHKKINLTLRYRYEQKEQNEPGNTTSMDQLIVAERNNTGADLDYDPEKRIGLRTRVQWAEFKQARGVSKGMAIAQDIEIRWQKVRVTLRGSVFDTDDYNSRIYMYEPDVLYAFYVPAYYGSGVRSMVILNVKIAENVQLWFRYSQTVMNNVTSIGSGLDQTPGNKRGEVKVQLKLGL